MNKRITIQHNKYNNNSVGINDVVYKVVKGDHITYQDRIIFQESHPKDFCGALADYLKRIKNKETEYRKNKKVKNIPQLFAVFLNEEPNGFKYLGARVKPYTFKFELKSKFKNLVPEIQNKITKINIRTKINYNEEINRLIRSCDSMDFLTVDYDPISKYHKLPEEFKRNGYPKIRQKRLDALVWAFQKNAAKIRAGMKLKEEGIPYAKENATELSRIGVEVFNYTGGNKFTIFRTPKFSPYFKKALEVLIDKTSLKKVNELTGVKQDRIEKFRTGEARFTFEEAKAIEAFYNDKFRTPKNLVTTEKNVVPVHREITGVEEIRAEVPQIHKEFSAPIIEGYDKLYDYFKEIFELCKKQSKF